MPELPEVETIRRDLADYLILPAEISECRIYDYDFMEKHSNIHSEKILHNKTVHQIDRHGKKLIFRLSSEFLVFHLGMSGQILSSLENTKYPHHVRFYLKIGDKKIYYVDIRKFGKINIFPENQEDIIYSGLDPVKQKIEINMLRDILQSAQNIKSLLMEQKHIVGIGNIYANEILFCAGIHPMRKANSLKGPEIAKLQFCIEKILAKAIRNFGTTFSIYRNLKGREGKNSDFLKVYGRNGLKCLVCGTEINKIVIQQRSTFFCPTCQK